MLGTSVSTKQPVERLAAATNVVDPIGPGLVALDAATLPPTDDRSGHERSRARSCLMRQSLYASTASSFLVPAFSFPLRLCFAADDPSGTTVDAASAVCVT